ncbi:MAG: metal-dependent hydrolase [Cohaesibacter sp.]|nr:metal-dependent hydrolase [Cohaesibacter sp.]MCV6600329.1 metal-dependent hydrolase [Cohaesibacter sp.]
MDSLTQAVLGGTIGYAVGGTQLGRKAALWGMGLGTLPDLDVLVSFSDPIEDFIYHRSWSHSLIMLSLVSPLIAEGIRHLHKMPKENRLTLWFMTWLVLITHPLLDSLTSYGTQLLWPVTSHPFAISSISIIDPLYTFPLLIATLWALIGGRSQNRREQEAGHCNKAGKASIIALVISSLYLGWGLLMQSHISQKLATQMAKAQTASTLAPQPILVTPTIGNSLLWYVLIMEKDQARYGWVSLLDDKDKTIEWMIMDRNLDLLTKESEQPDLVKSLKAFTHGFYALEQRPDQQILLKDMRMGIAPNFVFRFLIAQKEAETVTWKQPSVQIPRDIDPNSLNFVWNRMLAR